MGTFTNIFETIRNAAPDLFEDPFIEDLDLNNPEGVSVALENALFEAYSVMGKEGRLIPSDQVRLYIVHQAQSPNGTKFNMLFVVQRKVPEFAI